MLCRYYAFDHPPLRYPRSSREKRKASCLALTRESHLCARFVPPNYLSYASKNTRRFRLLQARLLPQSSTGVYSTLDGASANWFARIWKFLPKKCDAVRCPVGFLMPSHDSRLPHLHTSGPGSPENLLHISTQNLVAQLDRLLFRPIAIDYKPLS